MTNKERPPDDATTPADLAFRQPASAERLAFGTLEAAVLATLDSLREIRRRWGVATPDERKVLAQHVREDARELGDAGHDLARLMREIVNED